MTGLLSGDGLAAGVQQALAVPLQTRLGARRLDPDDPVAGVWFEVGDLASTGAPPPANAG